MCEQTHSAQGGQLEGWMGSILGFKAALMAAAVSKALVCTGTSVAESSWVQTSLGMYFDFCWEGAEEPCSSIPEWPFL